MRVAVAHLYACLSKCGPCCIDAGRKEQKTRWGSRLTQSNEGWIEGDIGNSAPHSDNKYKLTRSKRDGGAGGGGVVPSWEEDAVAETDRDRSRGEHNTDRIRFYLAAKGGRLR